MSNDKIINSQTIKTENAIHTVILSLTPGGDYCRTILSTDQDWHNKELRFDNYTQAEKRYNADVAALGGTIELSEREQWVADKVKGYMDRLEDEISEDVSDYAPNQTPFTGDDSKDETALQETAGELETEIKDGIRAYLAQ